MCQSPSKVCLTSRSQPGFPSQLGQRQSFVSGMPSHPHVATQDECPPPRSACFRVWAAGVVEVLPSPSLIHEGRGKPHWLALQGTQSYKPHLIALPTGLAKPLMQNISLFSPRSVPNHCCRRQAALGAAALLPPD